MLTRIDFDTWRANRIQGQFLSHRNPDTSNYIEFIVRLGECDLFTVKCNKHLVLETNDFQKAATEYTRLCYVK